jgi:hypothetical protein
MPFSVVQNPIIFFPFFLWLLVSLDKRIVIDWVDWSSFSLCREIPAVLLSISIRILVV